MYPKSTRLEGKPQAVCRAVRNIASAGAAPAAYYPGAQAGVNLRSADGASRFLLGRIAETASDVTVGAFPGIVQSMPRAVCEDIVRSDGNAHQIGFLRVATNDLVLDLEGFESEAAYPQLPQGAVMKA